MEGCNGGMGIVQWVMVKKKKEMGIMGREKMREKWRKRREGKIGK